jgi:ribosomal protein S27AE
VDDELRAAERRYKASRSKQDKKKLNAARRRAGWTKELVPCTRCGPGRLVKCHGRYVLCGECGGQGWTHEAWMPPEPEDASA